MALSREEAQSTAERADNILIVMKLSDMGRLLFAIASGDQSGIQAGLLQMAETTGVYGGNFQPVTSTPKARQNKWRELAQFLGLAALIVWEGRRSK